MSKILNKYIIELDHVDKTVLVLSGTSSGVSLCSSTTVTGIIVGIASANIRFLSLLLKRLFSENVSENKTKGKK